MAPQLKEYSVAAETSERARIEAFEHDLTEPITETEIDEIRGFYDNWYNDYKYELEQTEPEKLRATGEALLETPYDSLKKTQTPLEFLPNDLVTEALLYAHVDTRMHLHPSRIESLKREEKRPFIPTVEKNIPSVARFVANGEPIHSSEFTFKPLSESDAKRRGLNPVGSARQLLCDGLWVHTSNLDSTQDEYPEVTSYMMLNSTPDNLSAQGQARASTLQMRNFISMDSIWNKVENQFTMHQRIVELIDQDPILATHPDREFLTDRSKKMVGLTVKASERDALARLDYFAQKGMLPGAVRVYDPRSRSEQTLNAINSIRREYPTLPIFAGNFTSIYDIQAAEDLGANAAIYILGGGGICLTPDVAKIAVDNMGDAYQYANAGIKIPLIADSSTGGTYTILTGAGVSGFMKGQDIIGIEKPPYTQWFNLGGGRYASNFSGEAGARTKKLGGGKEDFMGRITFQEGEDTDVTFKPHKPNIATNLYYTNQAIATSLIFAKAGSLEELRKHPNPAIVHPSDGAQRVAGMHHVGSNGK